MKLIIMIKRITNLKLVIFYRCNILLDKFNRLDLYQADSFEIREQLNTSQYSTAFYPGLIKKIFKYLPREIITGIFDLGSGKGIGIVKFRQSGIQKVGGVELREDLINICKSNLQILKLNADDLIIGDAANLKSFEGYNVFFLFNPFPVNVVIKVIKNLKEYFDSIQTKVYIVYINPVYKIDFLNAGFIEIGSFTAPISNFKVSILNYCPSKSAN